MFLYNAKHNSTKTSVTYDVQAFVRQVFDSGPHYCLLPVGIKLSDDHPKAMELFKKLRRDP